MLNDKLLINLRILSKIQKNGRISRSYDGIVSLENDTFYQSVKRFVTSDSRKQSVFEINSIITETADCIYNIVNSKFMNKSNAHTHDYYRYCEDLLLILNELDAAKTGIDNLKFTYSNDANIASQLDILLIKIQTTLKDTRYKLSHFQTLLPGIHKPQQNDTSPHYNSDTIESEAEYDEEIYQ